jgi:hypothetical protein
MAAETATEAPPEQAAVPVAASAEPRAPEKKAAKGDAKAKDAKQGAKGEKGAKGKGKKETKAAEPDGDGPSVAAHPRAARAVARAKSWGGLAGFVLGGYLSLPTNTLAGAGERALVAGLVCYVAAWAGAVFVWRRLVMLEIKGREQQLVAAVQAASARRELPAPAERPGARVAS